MGFENMQDYAEGLRKCVICNNHRMQHYIGEFGCNGVSHIVCITLLVSHNQKCEKSSKTCG